MIQSSHFSTFKMLLVVSLLIYACRVQSFASILDPAITSVSIKIDSVVQAQGSQQGGTTLYIRGTDFSSDASLITVLIGSYPCLLNSDGASANLIVCTTTKATNSESLYWLQTTVKIVGFIPVTCSIAACRFSYSESVTPIIHQIIPKTSAGNDIISIFGVHKATDVGDGRSNGVGQIRSLTINETACSMIDISQQDLNPNYRDDVLCRVYKNQIAGQYSFNQNVVAGNANISLRAVQTSILTGKNYVGRVVGKIDTSGNIPIRGGVHGHVIRLAGTGFPQAINNYTCEVSGQVCEVVETVQNQITVKIPSYNSNNTANGMLQKDINDTSSQQQPYIGGNGFLYTRYKTSTWKSMNDWLTFLHNPAQASTLEVLEQKTVFQLASGQVYGSEYIEYIRGYFHVPIAGVYTFWGIADDRLIVHLSSKANNTNVINMKPLLLMQNYVNDHYNPYIRNDGLNTFTQTKTFSTPGYYFLQIVTANGWGNGFYKLSIQTPLQLSPVNVNPTWQIDYFSIQQSSLVPQIVTVQVDVASLLGTGQNQFKLYYLVLENGIYVTHASYMFTLGDSPSTFKNKLSGCIYLDNYNPLVALSTYDSTGALTTNSTLISKYVYTLTINRFRIASQNSLPYVWPNAGVTVSRIQFHSTPVGGTYKIILDGVALAIWGGSTFNITDIPYSTNWWDIQSAFRYIYKANQIQVRQVMNSHFVDQIKFMVLYYGVSVIKFITLNINMLTGGASSTFSTTIEVKRAYSVNPLYDVIPYDLLKLPSSKPTLTLSVNSIPISCDKCQYQFDSNLNVFVNSAVLTGQTLALSLTDSSNIGFTLSDVEVRLFDTICLIDKSGTISNFNCNLGRNAMNGVLLPANNQKPTVHIRQIGFADTSNISTVSINLQVSSILPSVSGIYGGMIATLTGNGFPIQINKKGNLLIKLCNNIVNQFISISNTEIKFIVPERLYLCSNSSDSQISLNSQTVTISNFNYDINQTPTVLALSINSASPILKTHITVQGSAFTNLTKAYLYDVNNIQKYELTILTISNSTTMTCILGGGKSGDYHLRVIQLSGGLSAVSVSNAFAYQIIVDSISPNSGSLGGGYVLTINGQNFAGKDSHNVFIGDGGNLCKILTATSTEITCIMPRIQDIYQIGVQLAVTVVGRIVEQSFCRGVCSFTYDESVTSNVTVPAVTVYNAGDLVTVNGDNMLNASVTIGGQSINLVSSTVSAISFNYPNIEAGEYEIQIQTSTGLTHPIVKSTTNQWIGSASASKGSTAGNQLSIIANGLPNNLQNSNLHSLLICNGIKQQLKIIQMVPNKLTVELPPKNQQTCTINITVNSIFKVFSYTYSNLNTPYITVSQGLSNIFAVAKDATIFTKFQAVYLDQHDNPTTSVYSLSMSAVTSTSIQLQPTSNYLPNGIIMIKALSANGYAVVSPKSYSINNNVTFISNSTQTSFAGGIEYNIKATGFITNHPQNNVITICGLKSSVISANQTDIVISIPPLVTAQTHQQYSLAVNSLIQGSIISDGGFNPENAFDASTATHYISYNSQCYIGHDFGQGAIANIQMIKYMPDPSWSSVAIHLEGAIFEGSNDMNNWVTIFTVNTNQVHSGWNIWKNPTSNSVQYRYIRYSHNQKSGCVLAEIQFIGLILSLEIVDSVIDKICSVNVVTPLLSVSLNSNIVYSHSQTAVVTSIDPPFGPSSGNSNIKLVGINFGANLLISIDGLQCSIINKTATEINCLTGVRVTPPKEGNSFIFTSNGNKVIIATEPYYYIDRWSNQATWGNQALPREADSVYVPPGMSLLVDVSTPILNTIIVEKGKLIFADESDLTVDARYIVVNGGQFRIGTEDKPFTHKLVITLHGSPKDKQLPMFGSKVIGCRNCKMDIHGTPRDITWTEISTTILPGDTTVHLLQAVDWQIGQQIVIAGTGFDHTQSQQKIISSVSVDKMTLTVESPFKNKHYSAVETYNGQSFPMRAQVGLLSRNIKIRGDSASMEDKYGSHLLMTGSAKQGLRGRLSYAQFSQCGQANIVGRYCTHFHMAGEMTQSYIRGLSVHHSNARFLTIHGTHFLLVQKNVGYHIEGHNLFIQDGIETNNIIQDNLMISSIASMTLLQSDITVASYWITHPTNTVRRNHAAGGDFYGFWYEIKDHPDGPSSTSDICPMGSVLGESRDNVAHSNRRFGLRIFKLSARQFPCLPTQNESAIDPYSDNMAIQSIFQNYTLWKNEEAGFLGQQLGFTTVKNFKTADSRKAGFQFHKTNYTREEVVAKNGLIVGYSLGNAPININQVYQDSRGLITSRTDGLRVDSVEFHNFGPTMTPLQSCSECNLVKLWVTGGKTTTFRNISYFNINGNYIFWQNWRRQIFIDQDGTLTRPITTTLLLPQQAGTVTPYRPSLMIQSHCYNVSGSTWNQSIYCDQTITLRSILFTNANPQLNFKGIDIKVKLLEDPYDNFTVVPALQNQFSSEPMILIKKSLDIPFSWALPFATNQYYNVHWKNGIDFTHLSLAPSRHWTSTDGIVLRFNYSDIRQLFEIGKWYQQQLQTPFMNASDSLPYPQNCSNGEFYHDKNNRYLFICVSGLDKEVSQWTDINGIRCINYCPPAVPEPQRQNFQRLWSNITQWPGQILPPLYSNVTIPYEWNLILDIDPPVLNYLQVNGYLIFDRRRDNILQAHYIWVKKGKIEIGTVDRPFTTQAEIILHGNKDDRYLLIDPESSGNKILAVTGGLEFYGTPPSSEWTKLSKIAVIGTNTIQVLDVSGWKIGDKLVIAPSYAGQTEYQTATITSISGSLITINQTLNYEHYGAGSPTIQNSYGTLDARSAVGILNRNIKISSFGSDWGCRILIYGILQQSQNPLIQPKVRNGYVKWNGVQVSGCAQIDSYAGVQIRNVGTLAPVEIPSVIKNSVIHDCSGICSQIVKSYNTTFDNNIFYWARKFLVYVQEVGNYTFTNNLLIGARKRYELLQNLQLTHMVDDIACYEQYIQPIGFVQVNNNLAQGAEGQGFVFPITSCANLANYGFYDNTAGSAEVAFMFSKLQGELCIGASRIAAYSSEIGLMANIPGIQTKIIYQKMMFADNGRGITLRYANDIDDNTCIVRDSYFTGISRPNCSSCYSDLTIKYCNNGYAVRMFTSTISGEMFPLKKTNLNHDVICTQQAYDAKAFFSGVTFQNYVTTNPNLPYCSHMSVFRRHSLASDATASHYLTTTKCINCDQNSWARFDAPDPLLRGWFGGCGELDCTGPNNYLIADQDGSFTGQISQLLSNNTVIGQKQSDCVYLPVSNGHWCKFNELAVLEYQSIAPDFNKRVMWPVNLSYDGGSWTSITNGWKEWNWDGKEPMNTRLARFWSVIKLQKHYTLSYSSTPPMDSRFQIQKRLLPSGNPSDWTIIRISYPLPNSLEIRVKNNTGVDILVKPFPIKQNQSQNLNNYIDVCGANNFYYENGTIDFIVNGINNCQVRVVVVNTIKLTARLDIPLSDFYTNSGATTFISNICAFLGIDTSRLKIVGLSSGSTIIESVVVMNDPTPLDLARNISSDPKSAYQTLGQIAVKLSSALLDNSISVGAPILSVNTQVIVHTDNGQLYNGQNQQSSTNILKIVVIAVSCIIGVVIVALILLYCIKKRANKVSIVQSVASESIVNVNDRKAVEIVDITQQNL